MEGEEEQSLCPQTTEHFLPADLRPLLPGKSSFVPQFNPDDVELIPKELFTTKEQPAQKAADNRKEDNKDMVDKGKAMSRKDPTPHRLRAAFLAKMFERCGR